MADQLTAFQQQAAASGILLEPITDPRILHEAAGVSGLKPNHAVKPVDEEQLKAVVTLANKYSVPAWIAWNASGNALRVAATAGQPILIDLSKMNKIVAVDSNSGSALVEPGVSFKDLADFLEQKGVHYAVDSGRNDEHSILGSIIDRSFGYTAYGDRLMMQCGMEVMCPDGGLVRTGMGALPRENTWQSFKYGFGPYEDGIFTQSSLAVPTKIGFWISPLPPKYLPFAVRVSSDAAYVEALDLCRDLRINQVVPNTIVAIDGASETAMLGGKNVASWNLFGALYGIPKNVAFTWEILTEAVGKIQGASLEELETANAAAMSPRAALMAGKPAAAWKVFERKYSGRYLRLVFVLPIDGEQSLDFVNQTKQAVATAGFEVVIEQGTSWRALLADVLIMFSPDKETQAVQCATNLLHKWAAEGVGVVRASPALMGASMESYSEGGLQGLNSRLMDVFAA